MTVLAILPRAGVAALVVAACQPVCACTPALTSSAIVYGHMETDNGMPVVGHDLRVMSVARPGSCAEITAAAFGVTDSQGHYRLEVQSSAEAANACLTLFGRRVPVVPYQPMDTFPRVDFRFDPPFDSVRLDIVFGSVPLPPVARP